MPNRLIFLALATAIVLAPAAPAALRAQLPRPAGDNAMASPTDPQRVAKLGTTWIPAFAGMTGEVGGDDGRSRRG